MKNMEKLFQWAITNATAKEDATTESRLDLKQEYVGFIKGEVMIEWVGSRDYWSNLGKRWSYTNVGYTPITSTTAANYKGEIECAAVIKSTETSLEDKIIALEDLELVIPPPSPQKRLELVVGGPNR